ncbi:hypothetical protein [Methylibium rhizosphaerae]|uniref:hypothetical protein n=1 Tax=Methylibium rhizosphaerae TaxID=2570323 RepID=UPI00112CCB46|nr:hypothetical protein [Methylibium rhizosphaerae]
MPSLLGPGRPNDNSGGTERNDAQDTRILWALASDADLSAPARKPRSNGRQWMLALLLVVAVGASFAWWNNTSPEPQAPLAQAPAPAEVPVVAAADAASEPVAGAVLIDAPSPAPQPAAASAVPASTGSPLAALSAPSEASAPASAAEPAPRKVAAAAPPPSRREPARKPAAAKDGKERQAVAAAPGARTPDADVALLEAMVAHINSGQRGGSASAATTSAPRGVRSSTREQLKRCKAQSGADASACRAKVCSGRWGADPECSSLPRSTL